MSEYAVSALLLAGTFFCLVGSLGLARLPDFYMRLHAPTKATTLGVGSVLAAAALYWASPALAARELLIVLFLFATAPVSALLMDRAALRARLESRAPLPRGDGEEAS